MRTSETVAEIFTALSKAQGAFVAVAKSQTANITTAKGSYSYTYAGLDSILEMIRKPMADNGLFLTQPTTLEDGTMSIVTRITHTSGEWLESDKMTAKVSGVGGSMDLKAIGTTATYLRRYQLAPLLGIATEEDKDTGNDNSVQAGTSQKSQRLLDTREPMTPDELKQFLQASGNGEPSKSQRKFMGSSLQSVSLGDWDAVHEFIQYIHGVPSSKEMTAPQVSKIIDWVGANKANNYQPHSVSVVEFQNVLTMLYEPLPGQILEDDDAPQEEFNI